MSRQIYLDNNATTPVDPRVLDSMLPYLKDAFGNASSSTHAYGWAADEAVNISREQVAALINGEPDDILFTSGATEALNFSIKGIARARRHLGNRILVTATEHRAVLDTCDALRSEGFEIDTVPVSDEGVIDVGLMTDMITDETLLVAAIWANNETGVLNPIDRISAAVRDRGVPFLSDATQAVGKLEVDAKQCDMLVCSAHKFYGPKGVGVLYLNPSLKGPRPIPLIHGGGQERGLRGGTLNTPGIVGMGRAAELALAEMRQDGKRLAALRDALEDRLLSTFPDARINGTRQHRLPQTTNIRFPGVPSVDLMARMRDVAISAGSACSSGSGKPSHVLKAMSLTDAEASASIRIGLGRFTKEEDVKSGLDRIVSAVRDVRQRRIEKDALR